MWEAQVCLFLGVQPWANYDLCMSGPFYLYTGHDIALALSEDNEPLHSMCLEDSRLNK